MHLSDTQLIIAIAGNEIILICSLRRWLGMEPTWGGMEKNLELSVFIIMVSYKISQRLHKLSAFLKFWKCLNIFSIFVSHQNFYIKYYFVKYLNRNIKIQHLVLLTNKILANSHLLMCLFLIPYRQVELLFQSEKSDKITF